MKICEPEYYSKFKCIADRCSDTCCKLWQVELDSDAFLLLNEIKNSDDFSDIKIKGKNSRAVILPCKNGDCPFLEKSLLCGLYKKVGHDRLPLTCQLYPRFFNTFGGYEERGLSFSCPTAADLIFKNGLEFNEILNDDPITSFTDVNAERFIVVKEIRDYLIDWVKLSELTLSELIGSILEYAKAVSDLLSNARYAEASDLKLLNIGSFSYSEKLFKRTVNLHLRNIILRDNWKLILKSASYNIDRDNINYFKIWFCYFVYRYLIRSAGELDFEAVIKSAIISYFLISRIGEDQKLSMQLYSKETEHNKRNIDRLFSFSKKIKF